MATLEANILGKKLLKCEFILDFNIALTRLSYATVKSHSEFCQQKQ